MSIEASKVACPRCGHLPDMYTATSGYCTGCEYNLHLEVETHFPWLPAVRAELARRIEALWARRYNIENMTRFDAECEVMQDYAYRAANPLRLPGEGEA